MSSSREEALHLLLDDAPRLYGQRRPARAHAARHSLCARHVNHSHDIGVGVSAREHALQARPQRVEARIALEGGAQARRKGGEAVVEQALCPLLAQKGNEVAAGKSAGAAAEVRISASQQATQERRVQAREEGEVARLDGLRAKVAELGHAAVAVDHDAAAKKKGEGDERVR